MKAFFVTMMALTLAGAICPPATCAETETAHTIVKHALAEMGNGHDLHKLRSIHSSAVIVSYDLVQNDHIGAPFPLRGVTRSSIIDDLAEGRRMQVDTSVAATAAPSARTVRTLLTSDTERLEYLNGAKVIWAQSLTSPSAWEADNPIWTLLSAERASDLVRAPDVTVHEAIQHVLTFRLDGIPVRLFIDVSTGLPSATETTMAIHRATSADVAWNAWGDVVDRTEYMVWDLIDGRRYPTQWDDFRNGEHLRTIALAETHFDRALAPSLFAMQTTNKASEVYVDDVTLGAPIGLDPKKPITEIAPGIVQIPGSWYSTLVRQDDGVVIIDAPISAGYSRRVLDEAARRFPGLPVKALITSTPFFWHIAGIREYVARRIPIYLRDRNASLVRAIAAAPHTLVPDDLERSPRAPIIHTVSRPTVIGSGTHAITVMPISEGEQPMIMTWIADAHFLHTGEMVQPLGPNGGLLYPEALLELSHSVHAAGIPINGLYMIGMHMSPTPWHDLVATLHAAGG